MKTEKDFQLASDSNGRIFPSSNDCAMFLARICTGTTKLLFLENAISIERSFSFVVEGKSPLKHFSHGF